MCTVVSTYISHRILKLDLSKVELIPFISHLGLLSFCIHCLVSATANVYASKLKPRVNLTSNNPIIKSVIFCLRNSSQISLSLSSSISVALGSSFFTQTLMLAYCFFPVFSVMLVAAKIIFVKKTKV